MTYSRAASSKWPNRIGDLAGPGAFVSATDLVPPPGRPQPGACPASVVWLGTLLRPPAGRRTEPGEGGLEGGVQTERPAIRGMGQVQVDAGEQQSSGSE